MPIIDVSSDSFPKSEKDQLEIQYIRCPYCNKTSSKLYDKDRKKWFSIYPNSSAKIFPDVPENLYKDYSEACQILYLSPNASATLSRRCLQSMIKDRWGIERERLAAKITSISSDNISKLERKALEALKDIANIGAHPNEIIEVSIEDAKKTIHIIELFFKKWYIDDPAEEKMLRDIIDKKSEMKTEINSKKQNN